MTATEAASIEDLVRILVKGSSPTEGNGSEIQQPTHAEETIFDIEVDGARYLLIRLPRPAQVHARLSPREQEIVRLVALGHSNKIIGDVLNISSWTVCTHLRRIFAKLGVGSRAAMVARLPAIGRASPVHEAGHIVTPLLEEPCETAARLTKSKAGGDSGTVNGKRTHSTQPW
jgi:DNA-binding CsgD family transcriptional regulator